MVPRTCEHCQKTFLVKAIYVARGQGKFCNRKCALLAQFPKSTEERFWSYVQKTEDCWLWTANKTKFGYGKLKINKRTLVMHRYSYELHIGKIPEGLLVLHKCDVPACVNPDHLFVGTSADNVADRIRKGRSNNPGRNMHGELNPCSVLTNEKVIEIRRIASNRQCTLRAIGEQFGVSVPCISHIITRRTWKHI